MLCMAVLVKSHSSVPRLESGREGMKRESLWGQAASPRQGGSGDFELSLKLVSALFLIPCPFGASEDLPGF